MDDATCLLAVDLGTTTCRCLAFDPQGRPLAEAARETTLSCPQPGYAECDPDEWWAVAQQMIKQVMAQVRAAGREPVALGLTGLMHAMTPLDAQGRVLGRAMLWMDHRCQPQIDWLNTNARETMEAVFGPGARVTATPSLAKLRWLAENAPDLVAQTRCFLLAKDYLRFRLTGVLVTDATDAGGTMMFDRRSSDWSPEMVALARITRKQLPPIRPAHEVAGHVTAETAAATGLPEGLPVVVGMGDVESTVQGMGGEAPDRGVIYLGTAAWLRMYYASGRRRMRATATTGAAFRWLRDLVGGSYAELAAEAAAVPPGAEGLTFLPHLCGERAPFFGANIRGSLLGLSLIHHRGHLAQAVFEGCACHLRWLMEEPGETAPARLVVAGGPAKSAQWMQTLADVLGLTLWAPEVVEAGALGAATLAARGAGLYADEQEAISRMVRLERAYTPRAEFQPVYTEVYRRFRQAEEVTATLRE